MDERICVAQVIQEFVAQSFAEMGAGYQAGDVQELDRYRSLAVNAAAVVGPTAIRHAKATAGTRHLQVADGALRINGGEREVADLARGVRQGVQSGRLARRWLSHQTDQRIPRHDWVDLSVLVPKIYLR